MIDTQSQFVQGRMEFIHNPFIQLKKEFDFMLLLSVTGLITS